MVMGVRFPPSAPNNGIVMYNKGYSILGKDNQYYKQGLHYERMIRLENLSDTFK